MGLTVPSWSPRRGLPFLHIYWQRVLSLLYPPRCVACRRVGAVLCTSCMRAFPPIRPPVCPRCGHPLPKVAPCQTCRRGILRALDRVRSAARFQPPLREAIYALKYRGARALGPVLGAYMAARLRPQALTVDLIVPVPLHAERHQRRGYNQATLLAQPVAEVLQAPLATEALVRIRPTAPQITLPFSERQTNVAGAFCCPDPSYVRDRRILLVDDVMTSGSTLEACAAALKEAGARSVWGYTLARALPDGG